jgi:MFS family permease
LHIVINFKYLLYTPNLITKKKTSIFTKPQGVLVQLGIIGFCSLAAEGAMFDWSGVYFKEIVKAPNALVILGYASFMVTMATGRFLGDKLINIYGRKRLLQISGLILSLGMFTAVIFPNIYAATIGFILVGMGVSSIVPSVYSIAGTNTKVSPSIALAMVSGVSYFGFLMAPPLIGYISAISNLQYSFAVIGCFGILISILVTKISAIK